jgi:hypothetical protein
MSDFRYIGHQSWKNKRRYDSVGVYVFKYVGDKDNDCEIIKDLREVFTSQDFSPLEVKTESVWDFVHIKILKKDFSFRLNFNEYPQAPVKNDLFFVGLDYSKLSSGQYTPERKTLEYVLEMASKAVSKS